MDNSIPTITKLEPAHSFYFESADSVDRAGTMILRFRAYNDDRVIVTVIGAGVLSPALLRRMEFKLTLQSISEPPEIKKEETHWCRVTWAGLTCAVEGKHSGPHWFKVANEMDGPERCSATYAATLASSRYPFRCDLRKHHEGPHAFKW